MSFGASGAPAEPESPAIPVLGPPCGISDLPVVPAGLKASAGLAIVRGKAAADLGAAMTGRFAQVGAGWAGFTGG